MRCTVDLFFTVHLPYTRTPIFISVINISAPEILAQIGTEAAAKPRQLDIMQPDSLFAGILRKTPKQDPQHRPFVSRCFCRYENVNFCQHAAFCHHAAFFRFNFFQQVTSYMQHHWSSLKTGSDSLRIRSELALSDSRINEHRRQTPLRSQHSPFIRLALFAFLWLYLFHFRDFFSFEIGKYRFSALIEFYYPCNSLQGSQIIEPNGGSPL